MILERTEGDFFHIILLHNFLQMEATNFRVTCDKVIPFAFQKVSRLNVLVHRQMRM